LISDLADRTPGLGEQLKRRKPIAVQRGTHAGPDLERSFGTFQLMLFGVGATVLLEYGVSSAAVAVGWSRPGRRRPLR